jgi:hypothetical protein
VNWQCLEPVLGCCVFVNRIFLLPFCCDLPFYVATGFLLFSGALEFVRFRCKKRLTRP